MTYEQILGNLQNKIYHPVYFLVGEEPYFIDQISDFIEQNVLTDQEKEFNQTVIYGRDTNVPEVISIARRFPMMANYQVVIVKEAQNLDKIEGLEPYVANPLKSTILVICFKYEKIDKRRSFARTVDQKGILFESPKIYDSKVPDWIRQYVAGRGYRVSEQACLLLSEYLGNDLAKVVNEIGKIILNIPAGAEITAEIVEQNTGISKDFNVFELQKALGERNILKAYQICNHFGANQKENPMVKTVPLLYSYFSKTLVYHYLKDKSRNAAASALSVPPYFVTDYQNCARNYRPQKLEQVISLLREYDLKSKGVDNISSTDGELLKELIYKIMH